MKEKKCWHKWDKFKEVNLLYGGSIRHIRKTKVCRICGETRIKERAW
jgi:hypothetical protein